MDKTTLKTLSDDELSALELLVIAEGDRRFEAFQKAAEKDKNKKFQKEKKRMQEIRKILDKVVKIEWNGIKLTLTRDYSGDDGKILYWKGGYSGPCAFRDEGRYRYTLEEIRQLAPQLAKEDLKLFREYQGLREKVETTEN